MDQIEMEIARDILVAAIAAKTIVINTDDLELRPETLGKAYNTILAAVRNTGK